MLRKKPPSSSAVVGGNTDLVTEILLFLPAKSLIRFKSVSKDWFSLISSDSFSHRHTSHHLRLRHLSHQQSFLLATNSYAFFVCDLNARRLIPYPFRFSFVTILQSCNGLLLISCKTHPNGSFHYYICNPTTMQYRYLPPPQSPTLFSRPCLVFDPSEPPHYKVIFVCWARILRGSELLSQGFLVYQSEKHQWEKNVTVPYNFWSSHYFNNNSFFETSGKSPCDCLGEIPPPPKISSDGAQQDYTMESNGYLHHLRLSLKPGKNRLHVYDMKEVELGWSRKYHYMDFNPIVDISSGIEGETVELLGIIRGKTTYDSTLLFHVPGKLMVYKFGDKAFEELVDFTKENFFQEDHLQFKVYHSQRFMDSLAPV